MRRLCALVVLLAACVPLHAQAVSDELRMVAPGVSDTPVRVRVLLPPGYAAGTSRYPVLYLNDGQDRLDAGVEATLQQLYEARAIQPLIVVAIDMRPDRMGGYGLIDRSARHSMRAANDASSICCDATFLCECAAMDSPCLFPALANVCKSESWRGFQRVINEIVMNTYAGIPCGGSPRLPSAAFAYDCMRCRLRGGTDGNDHPTT